MPVAKGKEVQHYLSMWKKGIPLSSGKKIKSKKQAIAIGLSESRKRNPRDYGFIDLIKDNPIPSILIGGSLLAATYLGGYYLLTGNDPFFPDDADAQKEDFVLGDSDVTPLVFFPEPTPEKPASPQASASLMTKMAEAAKSYIGLEYQWGGIGPPYCEGIDCSGLVWRTAFDVGVRLPSTIRTASGQFANRSVSFTEEQAMNTPGALVWLFKADNPNKASHVGISTGDGRTIEAWWFGYKCGYHKWGWWKKSKKYGEAKYGQLPGIA